MKPLGNTWQHYWLVKRMAGAHGVDLSGARERGDLDQKTWAETVRRCRGCGWTKGCQRYLARKEANTGRPGRADAPVPESCCNRAYFATLKALEEMNNGYEFQ